MVRISLKEHQVYGHLLVEKKLGFLVVDDHQLILTGTLDVLSREYPEASIIKAQTGKETLSQLQFQQFDLIVMDLSIPDQQGETAEIDTGIKLLQTLLQEYPHQNFMVQTSYVKALLHLRPREKLDERIVIVGIDEKDIEWVKQYPVRDGKIAELLTKLETYKPLAIGLDIFKNVPVEPGGEQL